MKNVTELKRIFVRQHSMQDCGRACLAMILNYTGKLEDSRLLMQLPSAGEGVSLAQLCRLSAEFGLSAKAVRMDREYLATIDRPCILHTITADGLGHYQVFYGRYRKLFLFADPATQVHLLDGQQLDAIWQTGAAIYFETLPRQVVNHPSRWRIFFSLVRLPLPVLPVMAILSGLTGSFGLALSWFIQRAETNRVLLSGHALAALLILMGFIGLFRSVLNYLKMHALVMLNIRCHQQLVDSSLEAMVARHTVNPGNVWSAREALLDIQQIQQALAVFINVIIGDGCLVICMACVITCYSPWSGLLIGLSAGITIYRRLLKQPFAGHHLNHAALSGKAFEANIDGQLNVPGTLFESVNQLESLSELKRNGAKLRGNTQQFALQTLLGVFLTEIVGILTVIAVTYINLNLYLRGGIYFETVIICSILSLIITNSLAKICSALETVDQGADAAVQLNRSL